MNTGNINPLQATQEIVVPRLTTELTVCYRIQPYPFLLGDRFGNALIFYFSKIVSRNPAGRTVRSGFAEPMRS